MKHLMLENCTVLEIFEEKGKKWCSRVREDGLIMKTSLDDKTPELKEVSAKNIFRDYVYFYGKIIAYDKLKEIDFKFE
jgi:hypothetical protein